MSDKIRFPKEFIFGASTSAYQIEGAWNEDGKGESIWDRFVRKKGKIKNGDTGDIACDHYHRYKDDIKIMKEIGLEAYRFSINWPRIFPRGWGDINEKGIGFYDRLVDELLAASIEPLITIYHWDLPWAIQQEGGWYSPNIRNYFSDYSSLLVKRLGDRVKNWITLNEPWMFVFIGHLLGIHAPGLRNPWRSMKAFHNAMCAHGEAVKSMRSERGDIRIGITLSLSPLEPATESRRDKEATERADLFMNRLALDPIFGKGYPEKIQKLLKPFFPTILSDEMKLIAEPIDFLGVNTYTREFIRYNWKLPFLKFWSSVGDVPEKDYIENGIQYTDMGYEVYPKSLYQVLARIRDEYGNVPVIITENGSSFTDVVTGKSVHDPKRTAYLEGYIREVSRAISDGCDVRGYFVWSLFDNMEWSYGYGKRHGIVYVDFETQQRIIKDSGFRYGEIIRQIRL